MNLVALDFETYFANEYGLGSNKLTTEHYVRDSRFEVHGCGIRLVSEGEIETTWYHQPEYMFAQIDWANTTVLAHHAHFDGLILEHHYGIRPAHYACTLSMGRGVLGNHLRLGLESLARHFQLAPKNVPYDLFINKHWHELSADVQEQVIEGCCHDTDLTVQIFQYLLAGYTSPTTRPMQCFPPDELMLIDQTIRMFTRPRIIGDTALYAELWTDEQQATDTLLMNIGLLPYTLPHMPPADQEYAREEARKVLRSDDKFRDLLEAEGIEVAEKLTPAGNIKAAFAKTDSFMQDLLEGPVDDPDVDEWTPGQDRVRLLVQARLKAKSNLEQTRSERLGWMSTRGAMCVYINIYGAHTLRDSGGDKVNWQNQKRKSKLRKASMAPKGQLVGTVDASQIEARFLDTIAGEETAIQAWRDKRDIYSEIATEFYGYPVTKDMKDERGLGKLIKLSCGYGCGENSIIHTARRGTYGPPLKLTPSQGLAGKQLYRSRHPNVEGLWGHCGVLLRMLDRFERFDLGQPFEVLVDRAQGLKRIVAPNGLHLIYDSLEWHTAEDGDKFWRIKTRRGYAKLYGAKVVQNLIELASRCHTMQVAIRIERETGLWPWLRNHDELAYLITNDQYAEPTMQWIAQQLRTPPAWLSQIPLDAEYTLGERYEK